MKEKIYEILKLILSLLVFFYFPDLLSYILKLFGINVMAFKGAGIAIYQLVITFIMFIVLIIFYFKNIKDDYYKFKGSISKNIRYIIKMFLIFMIVKYIVSFISVFIMILLGFDISSMTSVNQNLIEEYVKAAPFLMFLTTAILAPIYEEILFRIGFRRIINHKWAFIIISGSLFGLLHVFPLGEGVSLLLGITQSISYVTMGIFLSYVYAKSDNIFMSIGIHFLNNLLSVLTIINML